MTISGAYSCLRVQLEFGREVSFFLQTIYFPPETRGQTLRQ